MEESLKYEEPKLVELDALLMRGEGEDIADGASTSEMMASYDGDDAEHEIVEF